MWLAARGAYILVREKVYMYNTNSNKRPTEGWSSDEEGWTTVTNLDFPYKNFFRARIWLEAGLRDLIEAFQFGIWKRLGKKM